MQTGAKQSQSIELFLMYSRVLLYRKETNNKGLILKPWTRNIVSIYCIEESKKRWRTLSEDALNLCVLQFQRWAGLSFWLIIKRSQCSVRSGVSIWASCVDFLIGFVKQTFLLWSLKSKWNHFHPIHCLMKMDGDTRKMPDRWLAHIRSIFVQRFLSFQVILHSVHQSAVASNPLMGDVNSRVQGPSIRVGVIRPPPKK